MRPEVSVGDESRCMCGGQRRPTSHPECWSTHVSWPGSSSGEQALLSGMSQFIDINIWWSSLRRERLKLETEIQCKRERDIKPKLYLVRNVVLGLFPWSLTTVADISVPLLTTGDYILTACSCDFQGNSKSFLPVFCMKRATFTQSLKRPTERESVKSADPPSIGFTLTSDIVGMADKMTSAFLTLLDHIPSRTVHQYMHNLLQKQTNYLSFLFMNLAYVRQQRQWSCPLSLSRHIYYFYDKKWTCVSPVPFFSSECRRKFYNTAFCFQECCNRHQVCNTADIDVLQHFHQWAVCSILIIAPHSTLNRDLTDL